MIKTRAEQVGIMGVLAAHLKTLVCHAHLLQHGADSCSVQALLGHSDISTAQDIHAHIPDGHLRSAVTTVTSSARPDWRKEQDRMSDML